MKQERAVEYGNALAWGFGAMVVAIFLLGVFTGRDVRYMGDASLDPGALLDTISEDGIDDGNVPDAGTDTGTLSVATQTPGMAVSVSQVTLGAHGWVVVHEIDGGHVLNALGARRLDKGEHSDVSVELLRGTEPGRTYAIILYADNGNKEFEIRGDLPMIDEEGNPLMQTFRTFGGGAGGQ